MHKSDNFESKAKQSKAKQSKAKQSKAKQSKAKQHNLYADDGICAIAMPKHKKQDKRRSAAFYPAFCVVMEEGGG